MALLFPSHRIFFESIRTWGWFFETPFFSDRFFALPNSLS